MDLSFDVFSRSKTWNFFIQKYNLPIKVRLFSSYTMRKLVRSKCVAIKGTIFCLQLWQFTILYSLELQQLNFYLRSANLHFFHFKYFSKELCSTLEYAMLSQKLLFPKYLFTRKYSNREYCLVSLGKPGDQKPTRQVVE